MNEKFRQAMKEANIKDLHLGVLNNFLIAGQRKSIDNGDVVWLTSLVQKLSKFRYWNLANKRLPIYRLTNNHSAFVLYSALSNLPRWRNAECCHITNALTLGEITEIKWWKKLFWEWFDTCEIPTQNYKRCIRRNYSWRRFCDKMIINQNGQFEWQRVNETLLRLNTSLLVSQIFLAFREADFQCWSLYEHPRYCQGEIEMTGNL